MASSNQPFSLYIHIPYCVSKCPYCDFNSHVVPVIPEKRYTDALLRELDQFGSLEHWRNRPVQSVFFGGGTPSTFSPASIEKLLRRVANTFLIPPDCEITLEANPGTVDQDNFFGYRRAGINRISIGVQSFQPRLLKFLGRVHSADEARKALEIVRRAGFENFNFDLIYANPGQTLAELESDLDAALSFDPPHLSAYNLTFEEGTPFHHEYRSGRLGSLSEDDEIAMAELIETRFDAAGLQRYEISNYAITERLCRHNVNYWRGGDYLGVGAGAHSYLGTNMDGLLGRRWSNEKNPGRYMALVTESNQAVADREEIDAARAAGEFLFLGLRMIEGISSDSFRARFGRSPEQLYPQITDWKEGELIEETNGYLRLTKIGLMVANSIFVQFV